MIVFIGNKSGWSGQMARQQPWAVLEEVESIVETGATIAGGRRLALLHTSNQPRSAMPPTPTTSCWDGQRVSTRENEGYIIALDGILLYS